MDDWNDSIESDKDYTDIIREKKLFFIFQNSKKFNKMN